MRDVNLSNTDYFGVARLKGLYYTRTSICMGRDMIASTGTTIRAHINSFVAAVVLLFAATATAGVILKIDIANPDEIKFIATGVSSEIDIEGDSPFATAAYGITLKDVLAADPDSTTLLIDGTLSPFDKTAYNTVDIVPLSDTDADYPNAINIYYDEGDDEADAKPQGFTTSRQALAGDSTVITDSGSSYTLKDVSSTGDIVAGYSTTVGGVSEPIGQWEIIDSNSAVECPQGSYTLNTQAQVDDFPQNCKSVLDDISVRDSSDIINLDGLANLSSVGGFLNIYDNAALTNLEGLSNINSVGGYMAISKNKRLENLGGLAKLTSVGGDLSIRNNIALINLDGLNNLASVGGYLLIYDNTALINIEGLDNLASVGNNLGIQENTFLTNLDGLSNLTSVGDNLSITLNPFLTNLDGLASLTSVGGDLVIQKNGSRSDNPDSLNCQGIAPVLGWPSGPPDDSVGGDIGIENNKGLNCDDVATVLDLVSGPSQPVIKTATGGNESISLGFSLSTTEDALFPIAGYEATCTGGGESVVNNNASSPITVSGLTGGREYSCTVAPITNLGAVPLSNAVSATPVLVIPSTPQTTNIDYGDEEISLTVSVSNNGGSTISSYTATCTDGKDDYTGTSSTSRITVSGLTNGVDYSCSVTATNAVGTSTASTPSPPIVSEYIPVGLPIWLLYEASK